MMGEINIIEYLKTFSTDEPVYYYPNPGLAGDSLIACATFQLFDDMKINYRLVNWQKFNPEGKILFYGGGGNLVPYYGRARNIIKKFHHRVKKLVILPHTINNNEDLLVELGNNIDVICREKISYCHVKKFANKANVMLSDDLAFYLKIEKVLPKETSSLFKAVLFELQYILRRNDERLLYFPTPKQLIRFLKREVKLLRLLKKNNSKILNCFRTDIEKVDIELPENNLDLPRILSYGIKDKIITLLVSNQMLRFINQHVKIKTNRLHIAIAGALLNKKVDFYKNNYYKNEAVYRYSIENRFPNVRWMG